MTAFRAEVSRLAEKFIGVPLRDIQLSALIRDLVDAAVRFGLEIPTDFMMVGKALMTVEGIGRELDPELDVFRSGNTLFHGLLAQALGPRRARATSFCAASSGSPASLTTCRCTCGKCSTTFAWDGSKCGPRKRSSDRASIVSAGGFSVDSWWRRSTSQRDFRWFRSWRYGVWAAATLFAAAWMAWAFHVSGDADPHMVVEGEKARAALTSEQVAEKGLRGGWCCQFSPQPPSLREGGADRRGENQRRKRFW